MGLIDRIQAKMELHRIEDRYVKRTHRKAYSSGAQYIDGEYVYACRQADQQPSSRSSKQLPKSGQPSKSSSPNPDPNPNPSESSSSRDSNSSESGRTSSRGLGSGNKWSLFS